MDARPGYYNGGPLISAAELIDARSSELLTKDEARLVYWSQFPQLAQQAATTPPAIVKPA